MLLYRLVEEAFHGPVSSNTFHNVTLQAMLRRQPRRLEPLDIVGVVKHVLDRRSPLVNADGVASKDNPLDHNPVSISSKDGAYRHELPLGLTRAGFSPDEDRAGAIGDRPVSRASHEGLRAQEALELVLVAIEIVLAKDGPRLPGAKANLESQDVLRLYWRFLPQVIISLALQ